MNDGDWRFLTFSPREVVAVVIIFGFLVFTVCSEPPPIIGGNLKEVAWSTAKYYLPYGGWGAGGALLIAMTRMITEIIYIALDGVSALREDTAAGFFVRTYLVKIVFCVVFVSLGLMFKALVGL